MQSLKDIKIENISNESPLTAGEESSLTNSVQNNTIPTGMYINTQNMTNPTIVSPVKMEYGWNFSISGLKMTVKSGLEKIFLKFLYALTIFY